MARISIDNGLHCFDPDEIDEIWDEIQERNLYEVLVFYMDDETREDVVGDYIEDDKEFLIEYLNRAPYDLVLG